MTIAPPKAYSVRPLDFLGSWLVDDRRYFENAHVLLAELEQAVIDVNKQWPKLLGQTVKKEETSAAHWKLVRKRDLLSDSVIVFSAMSVEAFLNYYGVLRLGDAQYDTKFERRGLIPKLKSLLEICDSIKVDEKDEIVRVLDRIATRRNALVHPKTKEVAGYIPAEARGGNKLPETAREAVADMTQFFREFVKLVPGAASHVPPPYNADA